MKKLSAICGLAALVVGAHSAAVNAAVIATWSDPGTGSFSFADNCSPPNTNNPVGCNSDGIGNLTAASTGLNLNLPVLGLLFTNASYTMTDTGGGALTTTSQSDAGLLVSAEFEAGKITIINTVAGQHGFNAGDTLLLATFTKAAGVFGNVLSGDYITGYNVTFTGLALGGYTATAEQFSFSSSNLDPGSAVLAPADMEAWTATTSFTSSATLVPVPPAVLLFGSGLVGLIGVARRKAA